MLRPVVGHLVSVSSTQDAELSFRGQENSAIAHLPMFQTAPVTPEEIKQIQSCLIVAPVGYDIPSETSKGASIEHLEQSSLQQHDDEKIFRIASSSTPTRS